ATVILVASLKKWRLKVYERKILLTGEKLASGNRCRDYKSASSIFVRQFSRKIEVQSPGGFPFGISAENILWKQHPRNRRIAEVFLRCGLVERSGQGANLMFKETI